MGYALFILLNAVLFIRPEELWPDVEGARLYLTVMVLCLLANLSALGRVLTPRELARNPVGVCVLGMLVAVPLSNIARGDLDAAEERFGEFGKVVLYYFLAIGVLNSQSRLRGFLGWCVLLILALTVVTQLQWHEYIDIEQLRPVRQPSRDPETGEEIFIFRIRSTGIFNDPNDLCLVLVFGGLCCTYRAMTGVGGPLRWLWLIPLVPFGYTLVLTQSRGGMLGLMAGVAGYIVARIGPRRAAPVLMLSLPGLLLAAGGRQANISLDKGDTGNERVMLWAEGLSEIQSRPSLFLTGIGAGEHANEFGLVAHNSFVHAYVELGLIGGTAFAGMFYWAGVLLRQTPADGSGSAPGLARLRPFVIAMQAAYTVGLLSISRNYVVPTYLELALASCFAGLARPASATSRGMVRRTVLVGLGTFVTLKLFTQLMGQLGS